MEKFNQFVFKFLKYTSPIVLVAVALDLMGMKGENFFYEFIGFTTVAWVTLLIYIIFAVAFNEQIKNSFVRKMAGIKENDEREIHMTGEVSKKTFISMTGFLVLLLFLSTLNVNIFRYGKSEALFDKKGAIQLGLGLKFIESDASNKNLIPPDREYIIRYNGLPLTSDGTLILVLALQMGAFYYFSRREQKA